MLFTRIFFRYLFFHLLRPFVLFMLVFTVIWVLADLYNNLEDFLVKKPNPLLMIRFYLLQIPNMLILTLPAAMLFATLAAILSLNRRSELVALQSAGIGPLQLYSPFVLLGALMSFLLAFDLSGPAATAELARERLLKQVKGQSAHTNVYEALVYVDQFNRRVWFFQDLDLNNGSGKGIELDEYNLEGRITRKYYALRAHWSGEFWKFSGVTQYDSYADGIMRPEKKLEKLDLVEVTTPPSALSLIVSQPDQLTLPQLTQYIKTSTQSPERISAYRTEWWYRVIYPSTIIIFVLFALLQGGRTDRRSTATGLLSAIGLLISYLLILNVFLAAGRFNKLSPLAAATLAPFLYTVLALHLLARKHGWYILMREHLVHWWSELFAADEIESAANVER